MPFEFVQAWRSTDTYRICDGCDKNKVKWIMKLHRVHLRLCAECAKELGQKPC